MAGHAHTQYELLGGEYGDGDGEVKMEGFVRTAMEVMEEGEEVVVEEVVQRDGKEGSKRGLKG